MLNKPPRVQLFEFCDLVALPKVFRHLFHETLVFSGRISGQNVALPEILGRYAKECRLKVVLELAAGNGEEIADVTAKIDQATRPKLLLSDISPDIESYKSLEQSHGQEFLRYVSQPVSFFDNPLPEADGVLINRALHHLRPEELRTFFKVILSQGKPLMAIEAFERNWLTLFVMSLVSIFFPLMSSLNPKTISLNGIFFNWIIPVMPLIFLWDSVVSVLRCYSKQEILELLPQDLELVSHFGSHNELFGVRAVHFWIREKACATNS